MEFQFTAMDLAWLHLAFRQGQWQDPTHEAWDKVRPLLDVSEEENTTGLPLRLVDKDPGLETDAPLTQAIILDWCEVPVRRAFGIEALETMQAVLGRFVYHTDYRPQVKELKEKLKAYHGQAEAEVQLKKLPAAAVEAAARGLRVRKGGKA